MESKFVLTEKQLDGLANRLESIVDKLEDIRSRFPEDRYKTQAQLDFCQMIKSIDGAINEFLHSYFDDDDFYYTACKIANEE